MAQNYLSFTTTIRLLSLGIVPAIWGATTITVHAATPVTPSTTAAPSTVDTTSNTVPLKTSQTSSEPTPAAPTTPVTDNVAEPATPIADNSAASDNVTDNAPADTTESNQGSSPSTIPTDTEAPKAVPATSTEAQAVSTAVDAMKSKVTQLQSLAKTQNQAAAKWQTVMTQAQQDGRWALYLDGDDGLVATGNALITADYAYVDAVNGTTTPLTDQSVTTGESKNVTVTTPETPTPATSPSYDQLRTNYLTAVDNYNDTVTTDQVFSPETLPTAAELLTNFEDQITTTGGFLNQFKTILTTAGANAADSDQNATVLDHLTPSDDGNFTQSTAASTPEISDYNTMPMVLSTDVVFADNWSSLPSATTTGTFEKTVSLTNDDYGERSKASNLNYTPLKDREGTLNQFLTTGYIDPATGEASDFTLTTIATNPADSQSYYLAGVAVVASNASDLDASQVLIFDTPDTLQSFTQLPITLPGDKSNLRIFAYYLPVQSVSAPASALARSVNFVGKLPQVTPTNATADTPQKNDTPTDVNNTTEIPSSLTPNQPVIVADDHWQPLPPLPDAPRTHHSVDTPFPLLDETPEPDDLLVADIQQLFSKPATPIDQLHSLEVPSPTAKKSTILADNLNTHHLSLLNPYALSGQAVVWSSPLAYTASSKNNPTETDETQTSHQKTNVTRHTTSNSHRGATSSKETNDLTPVWVTNDRPKLIEDEPGGGRRYHSQLGRYLSSISGTVNFGASAMEIKQASFN